MEKSKLEEIIHRKSKNLWEKEYKELQDVLDKFFKNRPHFHQNSGWYRLVEPVEKILLADRERVIKNIEESELRSLMSEISRIQNFLSEEE